MTIAECNLFWMWCCPVLEIAGAAVQFSETICKIRSELICHYHNINLCRFVDTFYPKYFAVTWMNTFWARIQSPVQLCLLHNFLLVWWKRPAERAARRSCYTPSNKSDDRNYFYLCGALIESLFKIAFLDKSIALQSLTSQPSTWCSLKGQTHIMTGGLLIYIWYGCEDWFQWTESNTVWCSWRCQCRNKIIQCVAFKDSKKTVRKIVPCTLSEPVDHVSVWSHSSVEVYLTFMRFSLPAEFTVYVSSSNILPKFSIFPAFLRWLWHKQHNIL